MTNYKKILLLFLFVMPRFVFSADYCTDPDKYTVDKRCYVTEEQKQEIPYKAVVKVNRCTGTIVKKDGAFFMYTAKHCTDADIDNMADDQLTITLQNGISLPVKKYMLGEYDLEKDSNVSGDWAVYSIDDKTVPYVMLSNLMRTYIAEQVFDAYEVGYGSLKVMSDEEIHDFKQDYIRYLKDERGIEVSLFNKPLYGFMVVAGDGVNVLNSYVKDYIKFLDSKSLGNLFKDGENLKVSKCAYSSSGKELGCQGWRGDSGGGIFNQNGFLMGIVTRGKNYIGGWFHGKSGGNVNLLPDIFDKF